MSDLALASLIFFVLILIVLLNLEKYMLRSSKHIEMNRITQLAEEKLKSALGDPDKAIAISNRYDEGFVRVFGIGKAIETENKRLGDILGREGTIPELPSVFPVWHAFFKWIDDNHEKFEFFRLNKLEIKMTERKPALTFFCNVKSGRDESLLVHGLVNDVPIFTSIQPGRSRSDPNEGVRVLERWIVDIDLSKAEEEADK